MAVEIYSNPAPPISLLRCTSTEDRTSSTNSSEKFLSTFEGVFSSHPPIFESLLLQLPTSSIISLYHTSQCLRFFLQDYPAAWKHLSFRSPSPGRISTRQTSPASDASGDSSSTSSKLYSLDLLLLSVVLPFGTRLKSLELDYTAISGENLSHCVLHTRRETLQHLSVRGCKQVSLKYHILPFLTLFKLQKSAPWSARHAGLALKSLYTFRCRHHRRRPYTPSSRIRKDSDSAPTHDLIQLCHDLGIWTDTAWCPTSGGRCLRRKDYSFGRGTPEAQTEVWVVFDRLWRSANRFGPPNHDDRVTSFGSRGRLWEDTEVGHAGEPLGCEPQGKGLPAHLRKSHRSFIENVHCHNCGVKIEERCEHCSIRMHCMGCRKTLCQDCAFLRALPSAAYRERDTSEHFWWVKDAARNPNLMLQEISPSTGAIIPNSVIPPPIKTQWCCLRPMFSNGGSISFLGPNIRNAFVSQVRASPLPQGKGYEDPDFAVPEQELPIPSSAASEGTPAESQPKEQPDQLLGKLLKASLHSSQHNSCTRNLCQTCWDQPGWKTACRVCKETLCLAHDCRGLNIRMCGFRELAAEKAILDERSKFVDIIMWWEKTRPSSSISAKEEEDQLKRYLDEQALSRDSLVTLGSVMSYLNWPRASGDALQSEIDGLMSRWDAGELLETPAYSLAPKDSDTEKLVYSLTGSGNLQPPQAKKWKGCGSIMCPRFRPIGDHRPKCTAMVQQCVLCNTHVCPECQVLDPACDCSHCKVHYRCPNCSRSQTNLCKKAEEDEAKRRKEEEDEWARVETIRVLEEADALASLMGEFMLALDHASRPDRSEESR